MKIELKNKPRKFVVGNDKKITISDFGKIYLEANEMVSFMTESNKEYDIVAKEWGFYATPSVNSRLKLQGFKTALVKNELNKFYIMLVDTDKIDEFNIYLKKEGNEVVNWLDEYE